jgi:hypothetical protein
LTDPQAAELEQILRLIAQEYEALGRSAVERRSAMRRADTVGLARCIEEENRAVQSLADLERRRMIVVEALAQRIGAPAKSQTPVSQIAGSLPEPARTRLLTLSQSLRELMENVTRLNESTRRAAESLASHMEGLMRHVAAKLNHAQTYGPRGVVGCGPRIVSGLDSVG